MGKDEKSLLACVRELGGDIFAANNMKKKLLQIPPSQKSLPSSKRVSTEYRYNHGFDITVFSVIMQSCLRELLSIKKYESRYCYNLFGFYPEWSAQERVMSFYFFSRVVAFGLTGVGGSSCRAAYAAYCIRELFSHDAIEVFLVSDVSVFYYRVVFGNNRLGWYAYDPFINPSVVYDNKHYENTIMPEYGLPSAPGVYELEITPELCMRLDMRKDVIKAEMVSLLNRRASAEQWLRDEEYVNTLDELKHPVGKQPSITEAVLKYLREILFLEKNVPLHHKSKPTMDLVGLLFSANKNHSRVNEAVCQKMENLLEIIRENKGALNLSDGILDATITLLQRGLDSARVDGVSHIVDEPRVNIFRATTPELSCRSKGPA